MLVEDVMLPSRGIIYNGRVGDRVSVRPFTTKEYKELLTSNSASNINNLIDNCLQNCDVKASQFCDADKLVIIYKIRSITLGSKIQCYNTCPECENRVLLDWDIDDLKVKYLDVDEYPYRVTLPVSNEEITLSIATDELTEKVDSIVNSRASKFGKSPSSLRGIYRTVNLINNSRHSDLVSRVDWYEKLPVQDAIFIDQVILDLNSFGANFIEVKKCPNCGSDFKAVLTTQDSLFRLDFENRGSVKTVEGSLALGIKTADVTE